MLKRLLLKRPKNNNVIDLYVYRRFGAIVSIDKAATTFHKHPQFLDSAPIQQRLFYEWILWQYHNLKLPRRTS